MYRLYLIDANMYFNNSLISAKAAVMPMIPELSDLQAGS